jgi:hypothetical protein
MNCVLCEKKPTGTKAQRWHLNNYHGLSGCFCNGCYEAVSHDSFGRPKHPVAYRNAVKTLTREEARCS